MWRYLGKIQMVAAVICWVAAAAGVAAEREPFCSWLYLFAWWPLIVFLDGMLLHCQGESWLWQRPRQFGRLAFWSVTVWLVFEAFNLRLANWGYVGMEPQLWLRWPGYALAFATVLPGVLLTARVLEALGAYSGFGTRDSGLGDRYSLSISRPTWQPLSLILGMISLIIPLLWPRYAFPFIWITFIFLLDPLCDLLGGDSLLGRWLKSERQAHLCLVTAGLLTGMWWEMWNYPARAKWVYTLPLFNFGKIFEMPVLGYLGFLPFALECAIMYTFFLVIEERVLTSARGRRLAVWGQLVFWVLMFAAMDAWTVISYQ